MKGLAAFGGAVVFAVLVVPTILGQAPSVATLGQTIQTTTVTMSLMAQSGVELVQAATATARDERDFNINTASIF